MTIERARRGDRQAQAALLRHLQDPWYRLCRSLLADDDLARDATQETAMRFLRDLSRFRCDSSIATWSMGIAINVVREMRRSAKRNGPDSACDFAQTRDGSYAPDEVAERAEWNDLLRSMLNDLTERQREAIILRFFEDLSVQETAAAMSCAEGTVKATVHQALGILRNRLRQLI